LNYQFTDGLLRHGISFEEAIRKQDYYAQRQRAREYARQFDLTDEEIERRLDEEDRI